MQCNWPVVGFKMQHSVALLLAHAGYTAEPTNIQAGCVGHASYELVWPFNESRGFNHVQKLRTKLSQDHDRVLEASGKELQWAVRGLCSAS